MIPFQLIFNKNKIDYRKTQLPEIDQISSYHLMQNLFYNV